MPEALAGNTVNAQDILDTLAAADPVSWTPTWTSLTVGNATVEGWYLKLGRQVIAQYTLTAGSTTSWAGIASFTLPVEAITGTQETSVGSWVFRDNSATHFYAGSVSLLTSTTARCPGAWNGTAPREMLGQGGTSPVAIATSDKVSICLSYLSAS